MTSSIVKWETIHFARLGDFRINCRSNGWWFVEKPQGITASGSYQNVSSQAFHRWQKMSAEMRLRAVKQYVLGALADEVDWKLRRCGEYRALTIYVDTTAAATAKPIGWEIIEPERADVIASGQASSFPEAEADAEAWLREKFELQPSPVPAGAIALILALLVLLCSSSASAAPLKSEPRDPPRGRMSAGAGTTRELATACPPRDPADEARLRLEMEDEDTRSMERLYGRTLRTPADAPRPQATGLRFWGWLILSASVLEGVVLIWLGLSRARASQTGASS